MMVNGILDQYIVTERSDRRKQFNKTVNIMSKNLGVAQLDLNEARSKLELLSEKV